jgi:SAM-dependent methyltransferase
VGDHALYEGIGDGYAAARREDARIAARIRAALGPAERVVNVGAGSGNYEPEDRFVVAVEPAAAMIAQRAGRPAPVVQGVAEALPFPSGAFDAALAVLTLHHWSDLERGVAELRRVARRQVVFLFEPARTARFWGTEYFPEALAVPTERQAPGVARLRTLLAVREVAAVPVPIDCTDGFGAAYWGRPEAYLDPQVQAGMSWLALLPEDDLRRGSERLAADLASGAWDRRFGHLRRQAELDAGYRLVVAVDGPD